MIGNELNHTFNGATVEGGLNVKGDAFINGYSIGRAAVDYVDARGFGVTGVAADDQTAALQSAIDFCQGLVVSNTYGAPILRLPPGQVSLSSVVDWKSCGLSGAWPNSGTRIVWNGAAGGTVLRKWATSHAGNESFCLLENLNFRSGTAEPLVFVDLTTNAGPVDWGCRFSNLMFGGCTGDAIMMGQWINCHWEHLRFDLVGGYAIRLTPGVTQNLSSFRLDGFTYDHSRASSPGSGVFMIDNSADASNIGVVEFANGRIEVNTAWAAGDRGVVVLKNAAAPSATRECGLVLRNITYADAASMSDDVLLYRETVNTTASPSLLWMNVRTTNLSAVLGGNWAAAVKTPLPSDLAGVGSLNVGVPTGASLVVGTGARVFAAAGSPETVVTAPIGSLFLRTDGGAATSFYVKESGAAATGWIAK